MLDFEVGSHSLLQEKNNLTIVVTQCSKCYEKYKAQNETKEGS